MSDGTVCASLYGGPILSDVESRRRNYEESSVFVQRHLPELIKGGLNVIFLPAETMTEVSVFYRELRESKGQFVLVNSASDARNAVRQGKFACVLAACYSTIGSDPTCLEMLYKLGVRLFTMSGNRRNLYTDGCGEREGSGLSYSGIDLVGRLEDLGILIDVSHTSDKGLQDILAVTRKPIVVASHSNSRNICDNPRNLSDDQMKAISERGGMIGISFHPTLVSWNNPDVNAVAKHIVYMKELVGPDYVGIGTDFVNSIEDTFQFQIKSIDPSGKLYGRALHEYPKGVESISKMSAVFSTLQNEGLDESAMKKIRGENVLRVLANIAA